MDYTNEELFEAFERYLYQGEGTKDMEVRGKILQRMTSRETDDLRELERNAAVIAAGMIQHEDSDIHGIKEMAYCAVQLALAIRKAAKEVSE